MKKFDWILIGALLMTGIIFFIYNKSFSGDGVKVKVIVNQELFGIYNLNEEQTILINDHNILQIKDGCADMIEADCQDKLCVKQKPISKSGETIICLPNKVSVTVMGSNNQEVDAVVN